MSLLDRITALTSGGTSLVAAQELFELVNANLFVLFQKGQWGKREVRRIARGVRTFGATLPPIEIYQGRTGRSAVKRNKTDRAPLQTEEGCGFCSHGKEISLGNVSRG